MAGSGILSPLNKYRVMIIQAIPYNYPVPLLDDRNMPEVPSHARGPLGPKLGVAEETVSTSCGREDNSLWPIKLKRERKKIIQQFK